MQAGHALIGALMPEYDPVQKISIVPRGSAGGLTFFAPSEDRLESGLYRFVRTSQNSNRGSVFEANTLPVRRQCGVCTALACCIS